MKPNITYEYVSQIKKLNHWYYQNQLLQISEEAHVRYAKKLFMAYEARFTDIKEQEQWVTTHYTLLFTLH